jgi:FkbM family methyltransferase
MQVKQVKTTKEAKDNALRQPCEILSNLLDIFSEIGPRRIADIGACDGLSSIKYVMLFPDTHIVAFEPREDNYLELEANIKLYGMASKIATRRTAISDHNERNVPFFLSYGQAEWVKDSDTGNKSSSLLAPKEHLKAHTWCKFRPDKCDIATLDSFLTGPDKFHPFDFLHVDVQGGELNVFRGAETALKYVKAIWTEVSNIELYEGQPLKMDIIQYLSLRGFNCTKDTCGDKIAGDCFFERI